MKKFIFFTVFLFLSHICFSQQIKVLLITDNSNGISFGEKIKQVSNCEILFVPIFYGDHDWFHLGDKPLEPTKQDIEKINKEGENYLFSVLDKISDFDIVIGSFSLTSKDEKINEKLIKIQNKIVEYVKNGGNFIWINPRWEVVFDNLPISEIMPCKFDGKRKVWTFCPGRSTFHPLTRGLPFEITGTYWYGPVYIPVDEKSIKLTERENYPVFWYREINKGKVVFLYAFPSNRVEWLGPDYKSYDGDRPDESEVWYEFFKRVIWYLKYGDKAIGVISEIKTDDINYGEKKEINVEIENLLNEKFEGKIEVKIINRKGGEIKFEKEIKLEGKEKTSLSFISEILLPCTDRYLKIESLVYDKNGNLVSKSFTWKTYNHKIPVEIKIEKNHFKSGEKVKFSVEGENLEDKTLSFYLVDRRGRIILYQEKKDKEFDFIMPDGGNEFLSSYWINVFVKENEKVVGSNIYQIQIDDKWDMRNRFEFSVWTFAEPLKVKLFKDAGFNSFGCNRNHYYADRYGMRQYVEGPSPLNTWGIYIEYDNWDDLKNSFEKKAEKAFDSRSISLVSLQEEGGFDGGWGTRYYWKEDKAPEIPQKVFDEYLKELYNGDIDLLNEEWNTDFKDFYEIPLEREKCQYPSRIFVTSQAWDALKEEEKKKKIPVDFKEIDITKKYLCYSAPYYETYRFFDWYYQKYSDLAVEVYKRKVNPVPLTIVSAPGGFYQKVDVYNFSGQGPFYPKEAGLVGNAIARRDYGDIPGFSAAMWAYFDLYSLWSCTVLSSILAGNTHIDYWVDFPLTFNPDYTHTRASFWTKLLTEKLKPVEPVLLHKKFKYTEGLGLFIPEQPLSKGIFGRHFGSAINCNAPVYSALEESGYMPKVIKIDEINKIKVLICSYAQVIRREEGEKIKKFVRDGGILISTPWLASCSSHGNPYTVYPSPESGLLELLGFRLINTSHQINIEEFKIDSPEYQELKDIVLKSKGRDKVIDISNDVKIVAKYKDGSPAILERKYGKGKVIYLNFIYDWDNWWNSFYEKPREGYRRLFDFLIKNYVKNEYYFSFLNAEVVDDNKGWWGCVMREVPSKGDAIPWWASQLYSDPSGKIKYLAVFSDHRAPKIDAELILNDKNDRIVYDIFERKKLNVEENKVNVSLRPGDGKIFAILNEDIDYNFSIDKQVKLGDEIKIKINPKGPYKANIGFLIEFYDEKGNLFEPYTKKLSLICGQENLVKVKTSYNDTPGKYKVVITESITGKKMEKEIEIVREKSDFPSYKSLTPFPERMDDEFYFPEIRKEKVIENLKKLKKIYLGDYNGLELRWMLSYYLYVPFRENRHKIINKIEKGRWNEETINSLINEIKNGENFIFLYEDLNIDPAAGKEINPFYLSNLRRFVEKVEKLADVTEKEIDGYKFKIFELEKGKLILTNFSFDTRFIYHSSQFEIAHKTFKEMLNKLGI